jgi:hypothetical protein
MATKDLTVQFWQRLGIPRVLLIVVIAHMLISINGLGTMAYAIYLRHFLLRCCVMAFVSFIQLLMVVILSVNLWV